MATFSFERISDESDDERRRFARTDLVVRVEYSTVDELFSEFTSDINEGGVFIETDEAQEVGTAVTLQFHLPGTVDPVKTQGLVVWRTDGSDGRTPGMGVEFESLAADARERINEMIRSMRSAQ